MIVALYTVERHVQGAPSPVRYDERPLPDACDLAALLAFMYPAARVEVHSPQGLAGIVSDGAVRHPYTGENIEGAQRAAFEERTGRRRGR